MAKVSRTLLLGALLAAAPMVHADQPALTAEQDHRAMLDRLGIQALRPGPSGNPAASDHANYDEALANPFPDWPELLTTKSGFHVASAADWWHIRRPEIVADFEREVVGRPPEEPPAVTWKASPPEQTMIGNRPVSVWDAVGHVDNRRFPGTSVDIALHVTLPAEPTMPVLIMLGRARPDDDRVRTLVADGWGVAQLDPTSVQEDSGAGLRRGIIGLVNRGQARKPEDWGALRAWGWGAGRALDYLARLPQVDAGHIGVEGVSRYGKAALVTMAFDPRFAMVLVGSSGEGGAKPHRRNFGEAVENLTGSGEYHWMAGNFLRYGADRTAGDLPVDAHMLIALCAPRLVFISYGVPEKGDAAWLDQQGSFMATVAAGPAWTLLGAWDLGVGNDYRHAERPPVESGLLDGQLAWRQDDGGHTDAPNMASFVTWVDRQIGRPYSLP